MSEKLEKLVCGLVSEAGMEEVDGLPNWGTYSGQIIPYYPQKVK